LEDGGRESLGNQIRTGWNEEGRPCSKLISKKKEGKRRRGAMHVGCKQYGDGGESEDRNTGLRTNSGGKKEKNLKV